MLPEDMFITLQKKDPKADYQVLNNWALMKEKIKCAMTTQSSPNGHRVTVPVYNELGNEMVNYAFQIGDEMPVYNFMPRGREIIQRLVMKCTKVDSVDDFASRRLPESAFLGDVYVCVCQDSQIEIDQIA